MFSEPRHGYLGNQQKITSTNMTINIRHTIVTDNLAAVKCSRRISRELMNVSLNTAHNLITWWSSIDSPAWLSSRLPPPSYGIQNTFIFIWPGKCSFQVHPRKPGLDSWTGSMDWTLGLDSWTGHVDPKCAFWGHDSLKVVVSE